MSTEQLLSPLDLSWTFGDKIRKVRRASKMSQTDFAEALGVAPGVVSSWEGRGSDPRQIVAIARMLQLRFGVRAEWVLGLTDDPGLDTTKDPAETGPNSLVRREGLEPPTRCFGEPQGVTEPLELARFRYALTA